MFDELESQFWLAAGLYFTFSLILMTLFFGITFYRNDNFRMQVRQFQTLITGILGMIAAVTSAMGIMYASDTQERARQKLIIIERDQRAGLAASFLMEPMYEMRVSIFLAKNRTSGYKIVIPGTLRNYNILNDLDNISANAVGMAISTVSVFNSLNQTELTDDAEAEEFRLSADKAVRYAIEILTARSHPSVDDVLNESKRRMYEEGMRLLFRKPDTN